MTNEKLVLLYLLPLLSLLTGLELWKKTKKKIPFNVSDTLNRDPSSVLWS